MPRTEILFSISDSHVLRRTPQPGRESQFGLEIKILIRKALVERPIPLSVSRSAAMIDVIWEDL